MTALLVFGRNGQLAREIGQIAAGHGFEATFAGRETLDLSTGDGAALIERLRPALVINAAAYTAVDQAESDVDAAFRLNGDAPGRLAQACAAHGTPFIHVSTDYVFDGRLPRPYREDDPRRPLGVYGASKAAGEIAVEAATAGTQAPYAILRTAWLHGAFGANFVKTMLRLAADRDEVAVVDDQIGCPTWAQDAARAALILGRGLIEGRDERGLFHVAGAGQASWADFAEAIFAESRVRGGPWARVRRICSADYPTAAARPANSRLDCARLLSVAGWRPPPWREGVAACLDALDG